MREFGWNQIPVEDLTKRVMSDLSLYYEDDYTKIDTKMFKIEGKLALIPRHTKYSVGVNDSTIGRRISKFPPFQLREEQPEAVQAVYNQLIAKGGAVLFADCGRGKTVMGIEVARRLRLSTLVIVHKRFLLDQWTERINKFLPDAKIGYWQGSRCDSGEDFDFVIATIQTILQEKDNVTEEHLFSFGHVITDEAHRFAAPKWQTGIVKFPAKYRLGLTASEKRRDGMEVVFHSHIGPMAYRMKSRPKPPTISRVNLGTIIRPHEYTNRWNRKVNWGKLTTMLSKNDYRTKSIVELIVRAAKAGRVQLVLSDRRAHLNVMEEMLSSALDSDCLVRQFVPGLSKVKQKEAIGADIILATYKMAKEALDIPTLDTLHLSTPRVDVKQAVGRILREDVPGKKPPAVIDYVDKNIPPLFGFWRARRKLYVEEGYLNP